jgi:hypothetical protein
MSCVFCLGPHPRADTTTFLDEYEQDVDEIIAICRGDLRGAVRTLMLINEQLELLLYRSPGGGGCSLEILVRRSATR